VLAAERLCEACHTQQTALGGVSHEGATSGYIRGQFWGQMLLKLNSYAKSMIVGGEGGIRTQYGYPVQRFSSSKILMLACTVQ
jgi:hypothetical protein